MINRTLYARGMRGSVRTLVIFSAALAMYFLIIVTMYDPEIGSALIEFERAMPEMMAIVGMSPQAGTLASFLAAYLYGFLVPVVPMVYTILAASRLIARHIDTGSMAYLLAAPVKRRTVAFTQAAVMATGIVALIALCTLLGIGASEASFPGALAMGGFLRMNLGALGLHLLIGGICFFCGCAFDDARRAVGLGAGIPAAAFIVRMLANAGGKLHGARYATFFTLFDADGLVAGDAGAVWGMVALFAGAAALFALGGWRFTRRDLHL
jgi:ABC-2 type transport system permease protein